jgi:hypothetical protein
MRIVPLIYAARLTHLSGKLAKNRLSIKFQSSHLSTKSPSVDQSRNGNVVKVKVPQMGESITSGTMGQWLKNLSDFVKADEVVTTIDTDKVTYSFIWFLKE